LAFVTLPKLELASWASGAGGSTNICGMSGGCADRVAGVTNTFNGHVSTIAVVIHWSSGPTSGKPRYETSRTALNGKIISSHFLHDVRSSLRRITSESTTLQRESVSRAA
jgi:hypothetical protein